MPKVLMPLSLVGKGNVLETSGTIGWLDAKTNVVIGSTADPAMSTDNVAIGPTALQNIGNISAGRNIAIGRGSLVTLTTAVQCVAIGFQALNVTNASDVVAVGYNAGRVSTAAGGTFIGSSAGAAVTIPVGSTMVGYQAGTAATTGINNTLIGYNAASTLGTGANNVVIGANTVLGTSLSSTVLIGATSSSQDQAVVVGYNSSVTAQGGTALGYNTQAGNGAVVVGANGRGAGTYACTLGLGATASAAGSVAIGCDNGAVGANTAVVNEIKLGTASHTVNIPGALKVAGAAVASAATGTANRITVTGTQVDIAATYVGQSSITTVGTVTSGEWRVVIGTNNTRIGGLAGAAITTGTDNTHVGYKAGNATTGNYSTLLGSQAGAFLSSGSGHTVIGYGASGNGGTSIGQTAVGYLANNTSTANYSTALGYGAMATGAGGVAIGCDSVGGAVTTAVANEIKLGTANHTINIPGTLTTLTGNMAVGGANPASGGAIRIPNGAQVYARNATNTGDNCMFTATGTGISLGGNVGFWGATPANRDTGWTVGSYTPFRAGISSGITAADCANVLSTLITVLKGYGLLA